MTEGTASQPTGCVMAFAPVPTVRMRMKACAVSTPQFRPLFIPRSRFSLLTAPWSFLRPHLHVPVPRPRQDLLLYTEGSFTVLSLLSICGHPSRQSSQAASSREPSLSPAGGVSSSSFGSYRPSPPALTQVTPASRRPPPSGYDCLCGRLFQYMG